MLFSGVIRHPDSLNSTREAIRRQNFPQRNKTNHILFLATSSGFPRYWRGKKKMPEVPEVTETKAFMKGGGSCVCQGWQTAGRDWPVPARMGFAVNRSQLVQSEWKETATERILCSGRCLWSWRQKQNTIARFFLPRPTGLHWGSYGGELSWDFGSRCPVTLLTHCGGR